MDIQKPFAEAGFLKYLEHFPEIMPTMADEHLPSRLVNLLFIPDGNRRLSEAAQHLILVLRGRQAMLQAAFDTKLVADELRRYQKFARAGQPSPHIVQLRQQQGAVRHASSVARQSFMKAATAFARAADIKVPARMALDVYINQWIDENLPKYFASAM